MKRKCDCISPAGPHFPSAPRHVRARHDAPYVPTVAELTAALHALIAREKAVAARERAVLLREQRPLPPQWVY